MKTVKYYIADEIIGKLEPCPFCGGNASGKFWVTEKEVDGCVYFVPEVEIGCTKCPAKMSITDDLVEKWNSRKKVDGRSKKK